MYKKKKEETPVSFVNVGLPEELDKRLNTYCLKRMNKNGRIRQGLRTKIARAALVEWLDKYENDLTVEL
jgi:hypothetical protein